MENWILFSLISLFSIWFVEFLSKISAHHHLNKSKIVFYSINTQLVLSIIYYYLNYKPVELTVFIVVLIIIRIVDAMEKYIARLKSLKYIDSGLFFPISKINQIIMTFFVWIIFFDEYLKINEILSLIIGVIIILLLVNKKDLKLQKNYKKGLFYLILFNFIILISSSLNKYFVSIDFDIPTYLFLSSIIWSSYVYISKKDVKKKSNKTMKKQEYINWTLVWLFSFIAFVSLLFALKD